MKAYNLVPQLPEVRYQSTLDSRFLPAWRTAESPNSRATFNADINLSFNKAIAAVARKGMRSPIVAGCSVGSLV